MKMHSDRQLRVAPAVARMLLVIMTPGQVQSALGDLTATNASPLAVWDSSSRVTAGFGYRDNVARSNVASEGSGFFNASADASFIRLSEDGTYLSFYILGDDTRYFDATAVSYEQFLSGTAQGVKPIGANDELGAQFIYLYQHQVLDVSETEAFLNRVLVDGHTLTLRPHWKHRLGENWSVQLEGAGMRQLYAGELDDYWEAEGKMNLIRGYGHQSEFAIGWQSGQLRYDTRNQFTQSGESVPGTSLVYWRHEVSSLWRHYWDEARRWRTTSKFSYRLSRDNGSGYFDYDRISFSQQVRWSSSGWQVSSNARFGWYWYDVQQVGTEHRERSYAALDLRVERSLGEHWLVYAAAEREWNMSNDPIDEYDLWMAGGGIGIEF